MTISSSEDLYNLLKKRKSDYVFDGEMVERVSILLTYLQNDREAVMWYLGGPIFWVSHWLATKKQYKRDGISKTEQKIIALLASYEVTIREGYCVIVEKEQAMEWEN